MGKIAKQAEPVLLYCYMKIQFFEKEGRWRRGQMRENEGKRGLMWANKKGKMIHSVSHTAFYLKRK